MNWIYGLKYKCLRKSERQKVLAADKFVWAVSGHIKYVHAFLGFICYL